MKISSANDLDKQLTDLVRKVDWNSVWDHFALVGAGQQAEVRDETGRPNRYYKWLYALMKLLEPKQVIELGAAAGISTICMALGLPQSSKLISVDPDPKSWRWMRYEYPQVTKILGTDLDLSLYPKDLDLSATDVWFIDSEHTEKQLRAEFELYRPFWKKGAVVVLDDIHHPELEVVWNEIVEDKCDNSVPNHWQGFGLFIV